MNAHPRILLLLFAIALTSCSGDGPTGGSDTPAQVTAVSGSAQTATVGAKLSSPLVVKVTNTSGKAVGGATVTWAVTEGGGTLSSTSSTTDAQGQAQAEWILGTKAGQNTATAMVGSLTPLTFTSTGTAGAAAKLEKMGGDSQTSSAATALANPLVVRATDAYGNAVGGVGITWQVSGGGGTITPPVNTTDAQGLAQASWTLGATPGANTATATGSGGALTGVSGATLTFGATAIIGPVATVIIAPANPTVQAGGTVSLSASAKDMAGNVVTGRPVVWSTSDPARATVSGTGVVTGVSAGMVTITASVDGKNATTAVAVTQVPVVTLSVSPNPVSLEVGGTQQLTAVARDANGNVLTGRPVAWSSSNSEIATVSSAGVVMGVAAGGPVTVTAVSEGKSGSTQVRVTPPGTPVSGIINTNTTWTLARSPYRLTSNVQIAYGATLTIEPGVVVNGQNDPVMRGEGVRIEVWGTLKAVGTSAAPIRLTDVFITQRGTSTEQFLIHLENTIVNGGTVYWWRDGSQTGSLILRNSVVNNSLQEIFIWYPSADCYIEGNVFYRSGGISTGLSEGRKVYIRNNSFYEQNHLYKQPIAIENWASYGTAEVVVENNSFWTNNKLAVSLRSGGYSAARLTAKNNFWNTTDEAVIQSMIFDKNDDLGAAGYIEYKPFLTAPHPNTPVR